MDKQGKTITIKINGKDRLLKTDRHVEKEKNGGGKIIKKEEKIFDKGGCQGSLLSVFSGPSCRGTPKGN